MKKNSERVQMKKVKDTIRSAASYSSGDALKLFSQCAKIQLTLRANFMMLLSSHFVNQRCTSTRLKMSEPVTCNIIRRYIRPKKYICVFQVSALKKLGVVG